MTRKKQSRQMSLEEVVRAREWLVEQGLVECCGERDGKPVWRATKLGTQRGEEIVRAYSRLGKTKH